MRLTKVIPKMDAVSTGNDRGTGEKHIDLILSILQRHGARKIFPLIEAGVMELNEKPSKLFC